MSDHSRDGTGAGTGANSTAYNTPIPTDSEESDTPRPVTATVSLPAVPTVNVTSATPPSSQVTTGVRPTLDIEHSHSPSANAPSNVASPMSPGYVSVVGPSTASYFAQPSSSSYDSLSRRKRHSLVPSMGTGGTLQESPIEEETDHDSRSKLVPDQPLSRSPSQIQVPPPPPKPPSRAPSSILERNNHPGRRVSLPEPEPAYPQSGRRQMSSRSYNDITHDRPRSVSGRRSEPPLSPRPYSWVDRRYSDHELGYHDRDRIGFGNGNGYRNGTHDSGYGERNLRDDRAYPGTMAEEGRISRRSIQFLEQNPVPSRDALVELVKEFDVPLPEPKYPLVSLIPFCKQIRIGYQASSPGNRGKSTRTHTEARQNRSPRSPENMYVFIFLLPTRLTNLCPLAKATGWALNVAIAAQVILGALTTGVAAATTGRQTSIATSILGGLSTLAASYLAKARGSGEPETSITKCNALEQFVRDCEAFLLDYGWHDGRVMELHIGRYRKRFEEIQGNDSTGVAEGVVEKGTGGSQQNQQQGQEQGQYQSYQQNQPYQAGQSQAYPGGQDLNPAQNRDFQQGQGQGLQQQRPEQPQMTQMSMPQGPGMVRQQPNPNPSANVNPTMPMPIPGGSYMPPMPPLPLPGGYR